MKTNNSALAPILLKTILDILYWVILAGLFIKIFIIILKIFIDVPFKIKLNDYQITEFTSPLIIGIILQILISIIFIYIIYILRKVVGSFFKQKLFTPPQILGLKLIGQLIIINSLAKVVLDFILKLSIEHKAALGIHLDSSFDSLWFTLALGLFFILLSKSFSYAGKLQEENDLTV